MANGKTLCDARSNGGDSPSHTARGIVPRIAACVTISEAWGSLAHRTWGGHVWHSARPSAPACHPVSLDRVLILGFGEQRAASRHREALRDVAPPTRWACSLPPGDAVLGLLVIKKKSTFFDRHVLGPLFPTGWCCGVMPSKRRWILLRNYRILPLSLTCSALVATTSPDFFPGSGNSIRPTHIFSRPLIAITTYGTTSILCRARATMLLAPGTLAEIADSLPHACLRRSAVRLGDAAAGRAARSYSSRSESKYLLSVGRHLMHSLT